MARFSERMGVAPRFFQKESMDEALRNGLWSVTYLTFWYDWNAEGRDLLRALWIFHFHQRADECSSAPNYAVESIKKLYLAHNWAGVYDFLDFVAGYNEAPHVARMYAEKCNHVLRSHAAAYRLIGGQVTPITSDEEIASVEGSIQLSGVFGAAAEHIRTALARFSDRDSPDLPELH